MRSEICLWNSFENCFLMIDFLVGAAESNLAESGWHVRTEEES